MLIVFNKNLLENNLGTNSMRELVLYICSLLDIVISHLVGFCTLDIIILFYIVISNLILLKI